MGRYDYVVLGEAMTQESHRALVQQLFIEHVDELQGCVASLVPEPELVEDVVQETFLKAFTHLRPPGKAFTHLPRFQGDSRFFTWLTRIAINQCRNEMRRRITVKHARPASLDAPAVK